MLLTNTENAVESDAGIDTRPAGDLLYSHQTRTDKDLCLPHLTYII
jgi:hypothetical protein